MISPQPCAKTSEVSTALAVFSSARRSSMGPGLMPACRAAERTHAATPHALGELIDVPWYCAFPCSVCLGTGAMAPPGAHRVGSAPSGVGPRDEKEYDVGATARWRVGSEHNECWRTSTESTRGVRRAGLQHVMGASSAYCRHSAASSTAPSSWPAKCRHQL